jgi:hypothetical protein
MRKVEGEYLEMEQVLEEQRRGQQILQCLELDEAVLSDAPDETLTDVSDDIEPLDPDLLNFLWMRQFQKIWRFRQS